MINIVIVFKDFSSSVWVLLFWALCYSRYLGFQCLVPPGTHDLVQSCVQPRTVKIMIENMTNSIIFILSITAKNIQ